MLDADCLPQTIAIVQGLALALDVLGAALDTEVRAEAEVAAFQPDKVGDGGPIAPIEGAARVAAARFAALSRGCGWASPCPPLRSIR